MATATKVRQHRYVWFDTSLGKCALSWTDSGVTGFQLPEKNSRETLARLMQRSPSVLIEERTPPAAIRKIVEKLTGHLDGKRSDLSVIELDFDGVPPFHRRVYQALRRVPAGRTVSYRELAQAAGSPAASRAVGQAMARNPFPVVVPCHRVLGADGSAVGFSAYGGCNLKQRLLEMEGAQLQESFERQFDKQKLRVPVPKKISPKAASRAAAGKGKVLDQSKTQIEKEPVKSRRERKYAGGPESAQKSTLQFDADAALRHLCKSDKQLAKLINQVGDFRLELDEMMTPFETLAESIVYQQLTGKAAATIFGRVKALYGGKLPAPAKIVSTAEDELRSAGLSRAKAAALQDLSAKAHAGLIPTLVQLEAMHDDEIVERLTMVRGIGSWTVQMLLIFRLGRPDVLPINDYGVRKGFALTYGRKDKLPTPKELEAHGERWRPYRSVASWYLWRSLDKK